MDTILPQLALVLVSGQRGEVRPAARMILRSDPAPNPALANSASAASSRASIRGLVTLEPLSYRLHVLGIGSSNRGAEERSDESREPSWCAPVSQRHPSVSLGRGCVAVARLHRKRPIRGAHHHRGRSVLDDLVGVAQLAAEEAGHERHLAAHLQRWPCLPHDLRDLGVPPVRSRGCSRRPPPRRADTG